MKKFSLASILASAPVIASSMLFVGMSFTSASVSRAQGSDQITIKDPAEFNAYQTCYTATDAKTKASACESFLTTYPQSIVKKAALDTLVDAYSTFDSDKTVDAATRLMQIDPNNLKSMYLVAFIKKQQAATAAGNKDSAKQAQLLDDAAAMATKGLAATKPAEIKDEDFKKQKSTTDPFFHSVLAYDAIYSKKDLKAAIAEFRTELQITPEEATKVAPALNDTPVLGQTYTQLTPPDAVNAVWFLSRAYAFAPENFKPVIDKTNKYWYKRYHGGLDCLDDIKAKAAATVFLPGDLKIKPADTPADIANKAYNDNKADLPSLAMGDKEYILANASKENADALWAILKDQASEVPGIVIAATATQIQVAVTDDAKQDKKADFTVNMKEPLAEKDIPAVGSETKGLSGTYDSYTQTPPQIILRDGVIEVEKPKKAAPKKPSAAHKKS